ncbi:MAG: thermonuclease family protein [Planctomycetaceae bacterium]
MNGPDNRKQTRRLRRPTPAGVALAVCVLLITVRLLTNRERPSAKPDPSSGRSVLVSRVLDGDTLETSAGERIRLLGINAPEVAHHDQQGEPYGAEATDWLQERLQGKRVVLVTEEREFDMYGRTLAWVYDGQGKLINEELLETGNARLLPDFGLPAGLEVQLYQAEARASVARLGIWKK